MSMGKVRKEKTGSLLMNYNFVIQSEKVKSIQ